MYLGQLCNHVAEPRKKMGAELTDLNEVDRDKKVFPSKQTVKKSNYRYWLFRVCMMMSLL
jgi:hypothetical protein